jgi:4-hydroxybenzoate polyprenyltransferase
VTTPGGSASEGTERTLSVFRRVGYHLLPGDAFSYVLHMRPAEWPIMAAHTALGFALAVGLRPLAHGEGVSEGLWALFLWVVMLNGGTLAINSVFDKDEGDIGYLDKPPRPPTHLLGFSLGLMAAGQLLAFSVGTAFAAAYSLCFAMSIAYSVPPLRLKAVGGVDWLINMWGFGTLTPYAGWAASDRPLDHAHLLVLLGFCPLFAALYPLTQLYQFDEDKRRGDRTLALMLGMKRSLIIAILCTLLAFVMFTAAVGRTVSWRDAGIPVALAMWLVLLFRWLKRHATMPSVEHKRGMYAALMAWAVTDAAILLAFAL